MLILFVANRMPYPPFRGDKLKIFNLSKELQHHQLDLITIAESEQDVSSVDRLSTYFNRIEYVYIPKWKSFFNTIITLATRLPFQVGYFRSYQFSKRVEKVCREADYDAIHVQHIRMAQFIPDSVKHKCVLDLPDAFSMYWKRRYESAKNPFIKVFNKTEYIRLKKFEEETLPTFPLVLVCSNEDQRYLNEIEGAKVELLENGVDTKTFKPLNVEYIPNRILFTGNMDYAPNVDAVDYFVNSIFPVILRAMPDAQFIIAGQRPVQRVKDLVSNNVKVTGFIEDLSLEYAKAHVVVSPLRIGAGTQNKVLEALSMNIPVVTTYVGYEGLGLPENVGALPSSNEQEFAKNTIRILQDEQFRSALATEGGAIIRERFSWPSIAKKLENYLQLK